MRRMKWSQMSRTRKTIIVCLYVLSFLLSFPAIHMQCTLAEERLQNTINETVAKNVDAIMSDMVINKMVTMDFDDAKQILDHMTDTGRKKAYLAFCDSWNVDDAKPFNEIAQVYKEFDSGTMYKTNSQFVYIPKHPDANTRYCVHFAGGTGGWILRQDYAEGFVKAYTPNSVFIWHKGSEYYAMDTVGHSVGELLRSICKEIGIAPQNIAVTAASNGGYTTFYCAAELYTEYHIVTDKILSLDMGNNWGNTHVLISETDAQPLVQMQTKVYAFGRHDEIYRLFGAKQFAAYGVPLLEVQCKNGDHERINRIAFRNGTFAWAVGEQEELDPEEYKVFPVNF